MYIYILRKKDVIFYVGTTKDYKARYLQHYPVYKDFSMDIIDSYDKTNGVKVEKFYIIKYTLLGYKLLNSTKMAINKKQQEQLTDFLKKQNNFKQIIDFKPNIKLPKIKDNNRFFISEEIQKNIKRNDVSNIFTINSDKKLKYLEIYYALKGKSCSKECFFAINKYYNKNNCIENQ